MTGHKQSIRQPNWKHWLRRFLDGYKFSNSGFKRLFIVGSVGVPLLANIVSWQSARHVTLSLRQFTFADSLGVTVVSVIAYLIDFRVARWAYSGFSITWVKRLFIIAAVVVVPLGAAILVASDGYDRDYLSWSYVEDLMSDLFPVLFAYLLVVRVARWVCDGFAATHRAQNGAPPNVAASPDPTRNQQTPKPPPKQSTMKKMMIRFGLGMGFFLVLDFLAIAAHVDEGVRNDICGTLTAVFIIAVFYFQKRL